MVRRRRKELARRARSGGGAAGYTVVTAAATQTASKASETAISAMIPFMCNLSSPPDFIVTPIREG